MPVNQPAFSCKNKLEPLGGVHTNIRRSWKLNVFDESWTQDHVTTTMLHIYFMQLLCVLTSAFTNSGLVVLNELPGCCWCFLSVCNCLPVWSMSRQLSQSTRALHSTWFWYIQQPYGILILLFIFTLTPLSHQCTLSFRNSNFHQGFHETWKLLWGFIHVKDIEKSCFTLLISYWCHKWLFHHNSKDFWSPSNCM